MHASCRRTTTSSMGPPPRRGPGASRHHHRGHLPGDFCHRAHGPGRPEQVHALQCASTSSTAIGFSAATAPRSRPDHLNENWLAAERATAPADAPPAATGQDHGVRPPGRRPDRRGPGLAVPAAYGPDAGTTWSWPTPTAPCVELLTGCAEALGRAVDELRRWRTDDLFGWWRRAATWRSVDEQTTLGTDLDRRLTWPDAEFRS